VKFDVFPPSTQNALGVEQVYFQAFMGLSRPQKTVYNDIINKKGKNCTSGV
jgi:hypothetical protein